MAMTDDITQRRAYTELHFSVLLWGFTGILGRLIEMDSFLLVWYRLLFTCISLLFIKGLWQQVKEQPRSVVFKIVGIGAIAALHWVSFYGAIHLSNVSVAVGALALTSFFTALLEPLFFKRAIKPEEVLIGLCVMIGLSIMFLFGQQFHWGIIVGILSAFLAALFTTLNKVTIDQFHPPAKAMTFIELGGGFLLLCFLVPLTNSWIARSTLLPSTSDLFYLIILAVCCTTLPFILSLRALKKLSAFDSVLAINLEPIYSIILAIIIFHENQELTPQFYLGTALVILSVLSFPLIKAAKHRR